MEFQEERIDDTYVVTAKGRLDASASSAFGEWIGRLIGTANPKLLIDFTDVDLVTSAGLRIILILEKKTKAAGGTLALCGMHDYVREVFDISGLTPILRIYAGRSDGIVALKDGRRI
jgi:anti-anti-sigma factor